MSKTDKKMGRILITGALGQLGSELVPELAKIYGKDNVFASDIRKDDALDVPFLQLDVTDSSKLEETLKKYEITQIYHLAAVLSAKAESNPLFSWELNMKGLLNMLEAGRKKLVEKIFWPSSIAVFGPDTPKQNTPQYTLMNPTSVYGISKLAGERWCEYYFDKYEVDVRSLRYPGLIGYMSLPGGGTTDYAVDIFHKAITDKKYTSFLAKDCYLPMMYMPDAIMATIQLMESERNKLTVKSSYNLAGISFSPSELFEVIKKEIPEFEIQYKPDFRQEIANTWPDSVDDTIARKDWDWKLSYDIKKMSKDMLTHLKHKLNITVN